MALEFQSSMNSAIQATKIFTESMDDKSMEGLKEMTESEKSWKSGLGSFMVKVTTFNELLKKSMKPLEEASCAFDSIDIETCHAIQNIHLELENPLTTIMKQYHEIGELLLIKQKAINEIEAMFAARKKAKAVKSAKAVQVNTETKINNDLELQLSMLSAIHNDIQMLITKNKISVDARSASHKQRKAAMIRSIVANPVFANTIFGSVQMFETNFDKLAGIIDICSVMLIRDMNDTQKIELQNFVAREKSKMMRLYKTNNYVDLLDKMSADEYELHNIAFPPWFQTHQKLAGFIVINRARNFVAHIESLHILLKNNIYLKNLYCKTN